MAMNRHHNHSKSYKGQHLIGVDLQVQRFNGLVIKARAGHYPGRHGAHRAEGSASSSEDS